VCENCGVCMGDYYCEKCKFFDDETGKQQYHCDSCGICRIGGRENFFHCDRCASCYTIALQNGHPCVEKSMHQNCPVCFEYLFDSVLGISVLPCGHTMHQQCLREMHQHAQLSCPMCYKSIFDMTRCWRQLDLEISLTPMPEEYHNRMVWILCNDCGNSGEVVFHIVGQKCQGCGSYNTRSTCPPTVEVLPGLERNLIIEE
jgi:RING finger/CHY zinc finger protein 1